jgi:hypothetical protein
MDLPLGRPGTWRRATRDHISWSGRLRQHSHERRRGAFWRRRDDPGIYRIASRHGGVCTIGNCATPGTVTSVVAECRSLRPTPPILTLLQACSRRPDIQASDSLTRRRVGFLERLMRIEPVQFDLDCWRSARRHSRNPAPCRIAIGSSSRARKWRAGIPPP